MSLLQRILVMQKWIPSSFTAPRTPIWRVERQPTQLFQNCWEQMSPFQLVHRLGTLRFRRHPRRTAVPSVCRLWVPDTRVNHVLSRAPNCSPSRRKSGIFVWVLDSTSNWRHASSCEAGPLGSMAGSKLCMACEVVGLANIHVSNAHCPKWMITLAL